MLASISKKKARSWLIPFIKNSQSVIRSGDPYATLLFEKFNNQVMPAFEHLSSREMEAILYYIEIESVEPSEVMNDADISIAVSSEILDGKHEFLEHCSMCHFIHKESYFAPALGSVSKRHSREWLISFIRNSQKKIKQGDSYAENLYQSFDQHVMTQMNFLEEEEINSILDYIEFESTINPAYKNQFNSKLSYKKDTETIQPATGFCEKVGLFLSISMIFIMGLYYYLLLTNMQYIHVHNV